MLLLLANLQYPRRWLSQPPPASHQPQPSSTHGGFDANLVMVLAVLLCALICSLCVNSMIRCVLKCSSFIIREPNHYIMNRLSLEGVDVGLDKRALRTFPTVKYTKEIKMQGLDRDCCICLSEYKKGEKLRILPKCNHGFHVKCVDKWLKCHSSCPTCRQSLIDTCQKITGFGDHHHHHHQVSSSASDATATATASAATGEVISIDIVPLEREDLVRSYRC